MVNWKDKDEVREYMKEYRKKNKDKLNEKRKIYYQKNIERIRARVNYQRQDPIVKIERREYQKQWRLKNLQKHRAYNSQYQKKYPERYRARQYAKRHKQRDNHCAKCNSIENLQFHHTDYIKKEGFTMCPSCHKLYG